MFECITCMHMCVFVCDLMQLSLTRAAEIGQSSVYRLFHTPLPNTLAHRHTHTHTKNFCSKGGTLIWWATLKLSETVETLAQVRHKWGTRGRKREAVHARRAICFTCSTYTHPRTWWPLCFLHVGPVLHPSLLHHGLSAAPFSICAHTHTHIQTLKHTKTHTHSVGLGAIVLHYEN